MDQRSYHGLKVARGVTLVYCIERHYIAKFSHIFNLRDFGKIAKARVPRPKRTARLSVNVNARTACRGFSLFRMRMRVYISLTATLHLNSVCRYVRESLDEVG